MGVLGCKRFIHNVVIYHLIERFRISWVIGLGLLVQLFDQKFIEFNVNAFCFFVALIQFLTI